jgi:hypothetical protein
LLSYATYEVLKPTDGKIKYGTYPVNLKSLPVIFDENQQNAIQTDRVLFSISDPDAIP